MFVVFNCHYFFVTFSINKLPLLEKFPKRQVTELVDFFEMCREDGLTNNQCNVNVARPLWGFVKLLLSH